MRIIRSFVQKIKKNNTYKNKLSFYCSLCVFVPCILCSAFALQKYYTLQKTSITKTFLNLAEEAESMQENLIRSYRKLGSFFAQSEDLINYFAKSNLSREEYSSLFQEVEPTINRLNNTNQDILNDVLVFTDNAKIVQPEKQIYSMDTLKTLEYGKDFLEGEKKYQIHWDTDGGILPMIRKSRVGTMTKAYIYMEKFFHVNDRQMCVLVFVISPEKMFANNQVLQLGNGYVIKQGEEIVQSQNAENWGGKRTEDWILVKDDELNAQYFLKVNYSGLRELKLIIVLIYILVLLAMILIIFWVNRIISHMFGRLNAVICSMNQIKLGDFHEHLKEETEKGDEVSEIISQFNNLLIRLEQNAEQMLLREREKKNAEILALQYQINPHFLCNSMHIIQLAVEEKGCYEISDAIAYFVSVLRYNISGNMDATIGEELVNVQEYIRFLSFCRNAEIHVSVEVPKEFYSSYMIKFILQPVVENAVYHGYDRNTRQMHLSFRLYREGNYLHFEIENNGMQISTEQLEVLNEKLSASVNQLAADGSQKIGLANISYRMKLCFGSQVNIYMTSQEGKTVFHMCYPELLSEEEEGLV